MENNKKNLHSQQNRNLAKDKRANDNKRIVQVRLGKVVCNIIAHYISFDGYSIMAQILRLQHHYIKYYTPHRIHALTQSFQWQMPAQLAWDAHYMSDNASGFHSIYYENHPTEALYDLENDPWEEHNLANDSKFKEKLIELRRLNADYIRNIKDSTKRLNTFRISIAPLTSIRLFIRSKI